MTPNLILRLTVMIVGMTCPLYAQVSNRPAYVKCQSNLECTPESCCAIGPYKFSMPECRPRQEEGAACRPGVETTINTTLVYPDGNQIDLVDVHYIFCPCSRGLTCDRREGVCLDPTQKKGFNHLLGEDSVQDD